MTTEREERVISLLEQHRYLERSMIQQKLFRFQTGLKKSQQILTKMAEREQLSRFRHGGRDEYIYHLGERSQKWKHWLDVNRFHFSLLRDLRQWQRIAYYDFEHRYPYGQADAFYIIKLTLQGDCIMFFLEMDDGQNKMDKIQKYMSYEKSRKWQSEFWGQDGNFPLILIISQRLEEIAELVKKCDAGKYFRLMEKEKVYKGIINQLKAKI